MINAKSIIAVVFIAMLVGVLYVLFEKNFPGTPAAGESTYSFGEKKSAPVEVKPQEKSSLIKLPEAEGSPEPITGSTDLLKEAESLQMRDNSTYFEELKETVND